MFEKREKQGKAFVGSYSNCKKVEDVALNQEGQGDDVAISCANLRFAKKESGRLLLPAENGGEVWIRLPWSHDGRDRGASIIPEKVQKYPSKLKAIKVVDRP